MVLISDRVRLRVSFLILLVPLAESFRRAIARGAPDFRVFHHAWSLVWQGAGAQIYHDSPDRFLYSPGFAWFLAPLGACAPHVAFVFWCLLKVFAMLWVSHWVAAEAWSKESSLGIMTARGRLLSGVLGLLLVMRPFLVDIEYGQVNILILFLAVWGLATHLNVRSSVLTTAVSWFLLGMIALAKIFPLPLLLVPWFLPLKNSVGKLKWERGSVLAAVGFNCLVPVWTLGWVGAWQLLLDWRDAVVARGVPLESHNQSFMAMIHHLLSGDPTPIIAQHYQPILFGAAMLSSQQILLVSLFWTLLVGGGVFAWVLRGPREQPLKWVVLLLGSLILPLHLIWKAYFVMALPAAIFVAARLLQRQKKGPGLILFLLLFCCNNLTTFDVVGYGWGAFFEASSSLLVFHLGLLIWGACL